MPKHATVTAHLATMLHKKIMKGRKMKYET